MGAAVGLVETKVLRQRWEVEPRLSELRLERGRLLQVAALACQEAATATAFHAANASGTLAYHTGVWALRDRFVGNAGWTLDRTHGIEGILNIESRVRIIFSNVDQSCNDDHQPKPRSEKGPASELVCSGNLFGTLPSYTRAQLGGDPTFYLMVDEVGAVELSRPVVRSGTFEDYSERLYLGSGKDILPGARKPLDDDDAIVDFDPQVLRKK